MERKSIVKGGIKLAKVKDVIDYLRYLRDLDERDKEYFSLSNLKLQKLLYYCQAGHYKWDNQKLIIDVQFEAWRYGPSVPSVYEQFSKYGQNDIPACTNHNFDLLADEKETIEAVWSQLKGLHDYSLVESSCQETPWLVSYKEGLNKIINDEVICEFFKEKNQCLLNY